MSLKAFHLVFVAASILLALGFGLWAIREYRADGAIGDLAMGLGALLAACGMTWYSKWFLRKLRNVSFI